MEIINLGRVVGYDGADGKSAYQIWLDNGNTGTEQDFLNSLKGQDGADGKDGNDYVLTNNDKEEIADLVKVDVPTKVSQLENDKNYINSIPDEYITEDELSLKKFATETFVTNKIAEAELSGGDVDLSGYATKDELNAKVDKVKGKSLIDDTEITRLASVTNYDDTEIKNQINSKADKTDIPSKLSELENDKNYISSIPSEYITETELNNKKYLTSVPSEYKTKTENDSLYQPKGNYLTSYTESDPTVPSHVKSIKESDITKWNNKSEFSGNYNDLTNKPTIPTVPTNISAFNNDKGYLTSVPSEYITETELGAKNYATKGELHSHSNKSVLDNTTASYTTAEKTKLAGLKNYDDTALRNEVNTKTTEADVMNIINDDGIPDYWQSYLEDRISKIKSNQDKAGKDCFSFIVMTDMHFGQNQKQSPTLAKKIAEECNIKYILNLGDVTNRGAWNTKEQIETEFKQINDFLKPISSKMLQTQGNHDGSYGATLNGTTYPYNYTPEELYERIYRRTSLIDNTHFDATGTAYYVDDTSRKVRYIVLNSHCNKYVLNDDGSAKYNNMTTFRFTQSQYDFLYNEALKDLTDDWLVIVASHVPINNSYDTKFGASGAGATGDHSIMRSFLGAYKNKKTYKVTWGGTATETNPYDAISLDVDFSSYKGKLLGYFAGHSHNDYLYDTANWGIPMIITRCDGFNENLGTLLDERKAGTVTEQSFDVFTVNKNNEKIYATKIGAGSDRIITFEGVLSDDNVKTYTISNTLTNVTTNNTTAIIEENKSYNATLTVSEGCTLETVVITMGGTDITSSAYSNGVISISKVTGNIVITAIANPEEEVIINQIPISKATSTSTDIYNGTGYKNGVYPSGSDNSITEGTDANFVMSGYIPYVTTSTSGSTIYMKGVTCDTSQSHTRMVFITNGQEKLIGASLISTYFTIETLGEQYYKLTPKPKDIGNNKGHLSHIRLSMRGTGENWIVSLDKELE